MVYICKKQKYGGLGLRNVLWWNTAAVGKHVRAVCTIQDSLWVEWVHAVYLKDQNWLTVALVDCSWYWKNICSVKQKAYELLVGEGQKCRWDRLDWFL